MKERESSESKRESARARESESKREGGRERESEREST